MERESNMQAPPTQCRSGCGFYGNPATEGMCSVCFKEAIKKKQQAPSPSSSSMVRTGGSGTSPVPLTAGGSSSFSVASTSIVPDSKEEIEVCASLPETGAAVDATLESPVLKDDKKKKNRCGSCNKKVGLTGFECRCGGLYCAVHRYSDKHDCTFNYRELGAEEIRRNNPVVVGQKIQKI